jgi:secreted trypsin-like serine protease
MVRYFRSGNQYGSKILIGLTSLAFVTQIGCGGKKASNSVSQAVPSIINGQSVNDGDKFAVSTVGLYIQVPDNDQVEAFCTGTIIGPRTVITAGHCFAEPAKEIGIPAETFAKYVRIGFGTKVIASATDSAVTLVEVADIVIHPEYGKIPIEEAKPTDADPDLTIVHLAQDIPSTAVVATLVTDASRIAVGTKLTIAGFGLTGLQLTNPDEAAQDPKLAKLDPTFATSLNMTNVTIAEPTLNPYQFGYMTQEGRTACNGDSGGPAYIDNDDGTISLAGVTSWGDSQCKEFGVYTSVVTLLDWINENL